MKISDKSHFISECNKLKEYINEIYELELKIEEIDTLLIGYSSPTCVKVKSTARNDNRIALFDKKAKYEKEKKKYENKIKAIEEYIENVDAVELKPYIAYIYIGNHTKFELWDLLKADNSYGKFIIKINDAIKNSKNLELKEKNGRNQ